LPRKTIPERIARAIDLLGLEEFIDRKTGAYSGGMRRRLDLASGLLHQPDVLVLDEPTVGLDIDSRLAVWNFLRQLRDDGTTIVLTSHYLEEIDALADRVAIIDRGTIIASGTPNELKNTIGGDRVTLRIREFTSDDEVKTAQAVLSDLTFVSDIVVNAAQGNSLNLVVSGQDNALLSIQEALRDRGLPTFSIAQARPSLDDVYLAATGKTLMDAELAAAGTRDLKKEKKQEMAGK
jgi:ABC-2 type transport system ATP-binding protein